MSFSAKAARFIASGCYSGLTPVAPGTCGSLACLFLWYLLALTGQLDEISHQIWLSALCAVAGLLSARTCLANPGADEKNLKDPQFIVIDEWAGLLISLIGLHIADWPLILAALILFRFFDILKPGPISWIERLPGEWGIMLDDILSGLFVLAIIQAMVKFLG